MGLTDDDYDVARALLVSQGLQVTEASGHNCGFGSWYLKVVAPSGVQLRLVWDGRDQWLYVERCVDGTWDEVWTDRWPSSDDVLSAVQKMVRLAADSTGSSPQLTSASLVSLSPRDP